MSDTDWTVRQIDGVLLIGPVGPLDGITASRARARFVSAIDDVAVVVVDLTEVDFVDSAGLGLLVGGARSVRERGGVLALAVPRAGVRSMLADAGFGRIAVMAPTAEEAMTALASW